MTTMVLSEDIQMFKAIENSDNATTNGGLMSPVRSLSTVKNNLFPDITDAERLAGKTRYRKAFCKISNTNNLMINSFRVAMSAPSNSDDYVVMMLGTQRDTQSEIVASPGRRYAAAALRQSTNVGDTQIEVTLEDSALVDTLQDGDFIWLGNYETEEFHDNITVSFNGTDVTIQLESGDQVLNIYNKNNSCVCTVLEYGDLQTSFDSIVVNSVSGQFNGTALTVLLDDIGTLEQDWTFTMVNTNQFTCSGHTVGNVGTGYVGVDFTPVNSNFSRPYLTIKADGWNGTWQSGETLRLTTHPIAVPLWFKNVIPIGCEVYLNTFELYMGGESV